MTVSRHILETPALFQFDSDSAPCQPDNCRCTSGAMIASYYLDRHVSPTAMRKAMQGGSTVCGPTNAPEMVRGLNAFGIPSSWGWKSKAGVKAFLDANIPVDLAVLYGKIPRDRRWVTDMNFTGWHSVTACKYVTQNGETGILVRDPDHASPARPERPNYTFWPDRIWLPAFLAMEGSNGVNGIVVWPLKAKVLPPIVVVPPPVVVTPPVVTDPTSYVHTVEAIDAVSIRASATTTAVILGTLPKGARITTTMIRRSGGVYTFMSTRRTDWYGYVKDGRTVWVARAYTKFII